MYILLKTKITTDELNTCERDIIKFVCNYEMMYGQESMTFNLHILLHAVKSARKTGPLHANSAFPFESNIKNLKENVSGSKGMEQISRKYLRSLIFKLGNTKSLSNSVNALQFCENLFIPKKLQTYFCSDNVTCCGRSKITNITPLGNCLTYNKCIYKGSMYHSIDYIRAKKIDDTVVLLKTGQFCRIHNIIEHEKKCYLHLSKLNTYENFPFEGVSHILLIKTEDTENTFVNSIENVQEKVALVNAKSGRYLSIFCNTFEIQ